jgi:ADP-heptose:LPS heptosyltransferase
MVANGLLYGMLTLLNQTLPSEDTVESSEFKTFQLPQKTLIVPSPFIGDTILLTPLLQNLRQNLLLESSIHVLATPATAPLLETLPSVDQVLLEGSFLLQDKKAFLEAEGYDTLFLCRYALTWARAGLEAKVSQRIGFDFERLGLHRLKRWGQCLTHSVPSTSIYDARPQVEIYLDMLRGVGLSAEDGPPQCVLTDKDRQHATQLLKQCRQPIKILIHARAGSPGKQWPWANWVSAIQQLHQKYEIDFIVVGTDKDRSFYQILATEAGVPILNLCSQTHIRESIALMQSMDLVLTLDTSVAHMAAVAGTPRLIVLYGPTNQAQWAPRVQPGTFLKQLYRELPCRPCMARTCMTKSCIGELTIKQVLTAVEEAFSEKPL